MSYDRPGAARRITNRPGRRKAGRPAWLAALAAGTLCATTACSTAPSPPAAARGSAAPAPGASPASAPSAPAATGRPGVVAVTTGGAVVMLDPSTGAVARTLVASGAIGDEIAVSPGGGTAYFAAARGCAAEIESVPLAGGTPTVIAAGVLPAVSPDGTRLAFARNPLYLPAGCNPPLSATDFTLAIRTLSTGRQVVFPMAANDGQTLPSPISHLSWGPDGSRLAVSIAQTQDNEGWNVIIADTTSAKYYLAGPGDSAVPLTGPQAGRSYYREGVFLPDGSLFVNRVCCLGFPPHTTSSLMWEVGTSGGLVHQVAIGLTSRVHGSLDADATGHWLLYLSGTDLYVSRNGATPVLVASGLSAAAWQ
jgi:WD40-like Beta Propeller Repeat